MQPRLYFVAKVVLAALLTAFCMSALRRSGTLDGRNKVQPCVSPTSDTRIRYFLAPVMVDFPGLQIVA